ncbi:3221_t:CDS:2, partial [Gigaspora margarita]
IRELFHFISPYLKLPDQKLLSNRILTKATDEVQTMIKELAHKDKIGITIAFDSWCNVVNQELMGVVFITSSGETLIWGAEDISIERQQQEEVISKICTLFGKAKELNIKTLVTKDDAASNDDLKLPADVKIVINWDSFWKSLIILHNILQQESEKVIDDSMKDGITSEADFDAIINEWEELLINKEFEEETDDLDTEIEFLDLEMHPAKNQATKWKLHDLFSHNLPFSNDSI